MLSEAEERAEGLSLRHTLALKSACGLPEFTTFTVNFKNVLDYIFYEEEAFAVSQVLLAQTWSLSLDPSRNCSSADLTIIIVPLL